MGGGGGGGILGQGRIGIEWARGVQGKGEQQDLGSAQEPSVE